MDNNSEEPFADRLATLLGAWRQVTQILQSTDYVAEDANKVLHPVLRHTLNLMLDGDWSKTARPNDLTYIQQTISEFLPTLDKGHRFRYRCTYVLANLEQPWGHPVLQRMIQSDGIGDSSDPDDTAAATLTEGLTTTLCKCLNN